MKKENLMYVAIAIVVLMAGWYLLKNLGSKKRSEKEVIEEQEEVEDEDFESTESDCNYQESDFEEVDVDDFSKVKFGDNNSAVIEVRKILAKKGFPVAKDGGFDCELKALIDDAYGYDTTNGFELIEL